MWLKVFLVLTFIKAMAFHSILHSIQDNELSKGFSEAQLSSMKLVTDQWANLTFPSIQQFRRRNRPYTVNVEGIVGTGKSTFLEFFKHYAHIDILPEPVNKWTHLNGTDLLQLIFDDPQRWGMTQESYTMLTMLQEHMRRFGLAKVMERSVHSTRTIFVEYLHRSGKIQDVEYSVLVDWYNFLANSPDFDLATDLTVYLQTDPKTAAQRIKHRGRKEEANMDKDFLQIIHGLHEDWLVHRNSSFPAPSEKIIVINTGRPMDEMKYVYESLAKKIVGMIPKQLHDQLHQCMN